MRRLCIDAIASPDRGLVLLPCRDVSGFGGAAMFPREAKWSAQDVNKTVSVRFPACLPIFFGG